MTLAGTYDRSLVALSVFIAMAASFTALDLASRVRASAGVARYVWLATAALAMGGGIWAMHFVAMLAFSMPGMEVAYDVTLTLLSLLIAVVVTGVGFLVVSRGQPTPTLLLASGLFMGLGIVAMHYTGMAAMEMAADLRYDPGWVAASVLIAIAAATAALWLSVGTTQAATRIAAAIVMGAAISGMHYAAMQGATFAVQSHVGMAHGRTSLTPVTLALAVAASTFLILFLALIAAMFDRRFAAMAEREANALRQSEERFRILYTRTPLPLHSLDERGCIEHVTDAWLNLLGYDRDEVIGRALTSFMTEASAGRMIESDWPALLQKGELTDAEYDVVTRAGECLDVLASARVERDERGVFLRALGGLTNVTAHRRAEKALRQSQKMEAVGQLTGGVAHDFNNLLTVVLCSLELLRKRLPAGDTAALRLLDNAVKGTERGSSLTQRLLAFSRGQELKPRAVKVPELVQGMAELLRSSLGSGIEVETRFPGEMAPAYVDANQLELALLNLAVNARDAMAGVGRLTISAREMHVAAGQAEELEPGGYVVLEVADTGAGMDEATLARCMEPFFTTKGVGKGTGLGLSMVYGLAAQSGGRLIMHSRKGEGTTAELWLPSAQPAAADTLQQAANVADVRSQPPSRRTVLVVDDDPLVLTSTASMLEDIDYAVLEAASGRQALEILRSDVTVDLVVTDQVMPGMTGLELAAAVQQELPGLPVLLATGYAERKEVASADLPLLRKPYGQPALAAAIARCLARGPHRIRGPAERIAL
ncbi:MAG TPA: MHYT domain-containing protein [Rhodopila sp.]|nr:MHYT domain-containing protein [Rhodopila sp.]